MVATFIFNVIILNFAQNQLPLFGKLFFTKFEIIDVTAETGKTY